MAVEWGPDWIVMPWGTGAVYRPGLRPCSCGETVFCLYTTVEKPRDPIEGEEPPPERVRGHIACPKCIPTPPRARIYGDLDKTTGLILEYDQPAPEEAAHEPAPADPEAASPIGA